MTPVTIIITVVAYFLLLFTVSYLSGRKADNQGFFVGNRKSKWYVVAVATMGSFISGVTFVSVPGMVADKSFSYLQMVMGFIVGQFVIAFILIPLFYKMNLVSVYQYLEDRFGAKSYKTGAWFFFISKMLGASVRLFLVCVRPSPDDRVFRVQQTGDAVDLLDLQLFVSGQPGYIATRR